MTVVTVGDDLGHEHLDGPPARRREHGRRVGVLTDLEARQLRRRQHQDLLAARPRHGVHRRQPGDRRRLASTRRGCAAPRAAGRRRTRCGSAAARRPGSASPPRRRAGRCAAPAPRRSRKSVSDELARLQRDPVGLPVVAGGVGHDGVGDRRRRAARRTPRRSPAPRRRPARGPSARRSRAARPTRRATGRPRARGRPARRRSLAGRRPPPGKTHMPPAKAIEVWRRSR